MSRIEGPVRRARFGKPLAFAACLALAAGCTEAASTPSPAGSTTTAPTATATSPSPDLSAAGSLEDAVTVDAILGHLREFERIADANGGNRAAGTLGHEATLAYVENQLREAGLDVEEQDFEFPKFELTGTSEMSVDSAPGTGAAQVYEDERDFKPLLYSAAGEVDAPVTAVGVDPSAPPGDRSGGGCSASDFAEFPPATSHWCSRANASAGTSSRTRKRPGPAP